MFVRARLGGTNFVDVDDVVLEVGEVVVVVDVGRGRAVRKATLGRHGDGSSCTTRYQMERRPRLGTSEP